MIKHGTKADAQKDEPGVPDTWVLLGALRLSSEQVPLASASALRDEGFGLHLTHRSSAQIHATKQNQERFHFVFA